MSTTTIALIAGLACLLFAIGGTFVAMLVLRVIAGPDQVLVVVGRKHRGEDGVERGYQVLRTGESVVRRPFSERVQELEVKPFVVRFPPGRVGTRDGEAKIGVSATVRVAADGGPVMLYAAIERYLGKPRDEVAAAAGAIVLEAVTRAAARYETEELQAALPFLGHQIMPEVESELASAGLVVEGLQLESEAS